MSAYLLESDVQGSGSTLVLIHGVAGSLHIFDPIIETLSQSHTVIRFDLLGYGHSPKPRIKYTLDAHIEAIRHTLHTSGLQPPYTLVGLSMGVDLALAYNAKWPDEVRGFIGIGFPFYKDTAAARRGLHNNTWTRLTIEHPFIAPYIITPIWWLGLHNIIPAAKLAKIYTPIMAHETLMNPHRVFKSSLYHCMLYNPQTEVLKTIGDTKRLFIHGETDEWQTPAHVQEALSPYLKSQFVVIPDTGHNTVVLQPERTAALILSYTASLT